MLIMIASRDIPLPLVTSGCENSGNLRELALNRMKDFGAECRDVRFREVGVRIPVILLAFIYGIDLYIRSTKSTTKFAQSQSSFSAEIIRRTAVGRPSSRTRILSVTSSSDCCDCGSARTREPSDQS